MAQVKTGDVVASRFRIEHLLGVGGMATVFAARELQTERRVAIKILNDVLRRHPTIPRRFVQEARAAGALTTPFAVKMEGTGELADGTPYILMEFLEGMDLAATARKQGGKLELERALYLADQIAEALHDAHGHGVLHRDLKPENVFVVPTPSGEMIKVMDFGISKILAPGGAPTDKITVTGTTVGTPQYMPIEQLRGAKDLDGRVDVYALGVLLYEMLAGLRPFDGFSYEEVIMKVATQNAPSLSTYRRDLPPGLVDVIMRAMARDRDQRIPSMEQLRRELRPFWSGRRPELGAASPADSLPRTPGRTVVMGEEEHAAASAHTSPAQPLAQSGSAQRPISSPPAAAGLGFTPPPSAAQSGARPPMAAASGVMPPASMSQSGNLSATAAAQSGAIAAHASAGVQGSSSASIPRGYESAPAMNRSHPQIISVSGYATRGSAPRKLPVGLIVGAAIAASVVVIAIAAAVAAWVFLGVGPH